MFERLPGEAWLETTELGQEWGKQALLAERKVGLKVWMWQIRE